MSIQATLKSLTTAQLLSVYNALTKKSTTKFASRENGEKQTFGAAKVAGQSEFDRILAELNITVEQPAVEVPAEPAPAPKAVVPSRKRERKQKEAKPSAPSKHRDTHQCPKCGAVEDITPAGQENTIAGDERDFCHNCGTEFWTASGKVYNRRKPGKDVKASMSASWKDPEIRAARSARHGVRVFEQGDSANAVEYKSVAEAFRQLRLPMSRHIKFRMEVKDSGSGKFEHGKKILVFKLVDKK